MVFGLQPCCGRALGEEARESRIISGGAGEGATVVLPF